VANGEDQWVADYIRRAGTTPRIERTEAVELCKLAQSGNLSAWNVLFNGNLRLVVSLAKRYGNSETLSDLLMQGESGLRTAIERFDPLKNFAFPTYATWWIKQAIIRGDGGGNANMREPKRPLPSSDGTSVTA
jgi:DNA-directed RNA polymerase sigma subunit (sigma70/sigma32)